MAEFSLVAGAYQSSALAVGDGLGILCQERFLAFLLNYSDDSMMDEDASHDGYSDKVYVQQVAAMKDNEHTTLYVDFSHVAIADSEVAEGIQKNFYRFEPYLRKAVQSFVKEIDQDYVKDEKGEKEFFVAFYHMDFTRKIRDLRTERIGQLVSVTGTVTRTTEVRPELLYGTFRCGECAAEIEGVEQQFKYTEPKTCRNPTCNNRRVWDLDTDRSKFVDWQRIRVQENADEIPPGSMPRSLDVVVRGRNVEIAKAGDKCIFTGTLIVIPDVAMLSRGEGVAKHSRSSGRAQGSSGMGGVSGLKDLGVRDLTYRLAFLACSVECSGRPFDPSTGQICLDKQEDVLKSFTLEQRREIYAMKETQQLYLKMARSLAPNVFGHEDVKRGILLMLLGGVHKRTEAGMSLRGDINVCIVGDPSTAKSQFLKYVTSLMPRCVYTSGKASSAAGLTASVAKDPDTGEFCIEAGALMLADNGICCIDEFDKMDDTDQVAIHEAMEQQTITITKAGIQATLNARASILAAANPIHGRYDRSKTLRQNVVMSPPIMSRFDIFFVVLDQCDENFDERMANHIVQMHQSKIPSYARVDFTKEQIYRYIRFARSINPRISPEAQRKMIECYGRLRQKTLVEKSHQITVRQLESMVRLSEALARLYLDDTVRVEYVAEAHRLLEFTLKDIHSEKVNLAQIERDLDNARRRHRKNSDADSRKHTSSDSILAPATKTTTYEQGDPSSPSEEESADDVDAEEPAPLEITHAEFVQIRDRLAIHVRATEEKTSRAGVKQEDMLSWYLEQHADEIEDMEELKEKTRVIQCVIEMLVRDDAVFQVIGDWDEGEENSRFLTVNPNHVIS